MKKLFTILMLCFAMTFAVSLTANEQNKPIKEQPQKFAVSNNAP